MNTDVNDLYEKDSYNSRQNFLYKRALFGLAVYSAPEIQEMSKEKVKRINKLHRKTQTVLNLWKQEKLISITNQMMSTFFPKGYGFTSEIPCYNLVDADFICTLSFKDLGINKHNIVNKLISEKIFPKNFHDLIPTQDAN